MYQYTNDRQFLDVATGLIVPKDDKALAAWLQAGNTPAPSQQDTANAQAQEAIDTAAGQIVRDVVGDRMEEYRQAEEEAKAWAAADHAGEVPPSVASWAAAARLSSRSACDSILAQAAALRIALQQIRAARLQLKAVAASGQPDLALQQWSAFEATIRAALAGA